MELSVKSLTIFHFFCISLLYFILFLVRTILSWNKYLSPIIYNCYSSVLSVQQTSDKISKFYKQSSIFKIIKIDFLFLLRVSKQVNSKACPKIVSKRKIDSKSFKNQIHAKIDQKNSWKFTENWSKIDRKLTKKSKIDKRMIENWLKIDWKLTENWLKIDRKLIEN